MNRLPRPAATLQRGVIILPSALTLANLFAGLWAIVAASKGQFETAAWLIVAAAAADMLDGRVARATRTGSKFGEELDSLVDAISFGVAPALVIYHLFLTDGIWSWTASFIYVAGAVVRLARFNIEQAGHAKSSFHGLPSPTAGMTLATFYPFSQTEFFATYLADALIWPEAIIVLMVVLSGLMMSHILYPVVPKFGVRSAKGLLTLAMLIGTLIATFTIPALFFFPAAITYITWGIVKALVMGFIDRLPDRDPLLDEYDDADEAGAELRVIEYAEVPDELGPRRQTSRPGRRRTPRARPPRRGRATGPEPRRDDDTPDPQEP